MKNFRRRIFKRIKNSNFKLKLKELILYFRFYTLKKGYCKPFIIYMADGRLDHGGLTDRLKGIVSIYAYCKQNNREFKIHFVSPYNILCYLQSNIYDHTINTEAISYDVWSAKPCYMMDLFDYDVFKRKLKANKQLHCYCNIDFTEQMNEDWRILFNELFRPIPRITQIVDKFKIKESSWNSVTFRFMNYLNDFQDRNTKILTSIEQSELIEICDDYIKNQIGKLLICSDSSFYKQHVKLKYPEHTFICTEKSAHIQSVNDSFELNLMAFVDFYMIANSDTIYSVGTKQMYKTAFPEYAAKVFNRPFQRITIVG